MTQMNWIKTNSKRCVFLEFSYFVLVHYSRSEYILSALNMQALVEEEKQQKQADELLKVDERKRSYPLHYAHFIRLIQLCWGRKHKLHSTVDQGSCSKCPMATYVFVLVHFHLTLRTYNSLKRDYHEVTAEELEAYRIKRKNTDDPMSNFSR